MGPVLHCTWTRSSASTPIKDKSDNILLNINEQNQCWIEHFKETLNQPDPTVNYSFSMDDSPEELTLNLGERITRETWDAIKVMKNNKAAGLDHISGELLKCEYTVVVELRNLINKCWQTEAVQDE